MSDPVGTAEQRGAVPLPAQQRDLLERARELIIAAAAEGITLRVLGGVAIALQCESALRPPLLRPWKDLDLVARSKQRREVERFLTDRGLEGDRDFNALHGHRRMIFFEPDGAQIDIFVDELIMCHTLPLAHRLDSDPVTLSPADLLLSKLQVVEATERDLRDIVALLCDGAIADERIVEVLAGDWGWWRTATRALEATGSFLPTLGEFAAADGVRARIGELLARIDAAPKSRGWRLRARVGERVRWYELPEETDEPA